MDLAKEGDLQPRAGVACTQYQLTCIVSHYTMHVLTSHTQIKYGIVRLYKYTAKFMLNICTEHIYMFFVKYFVCENSEILFPNFII